MNHRPQTIVIPQSIPPAYSWWTEAPAAGFTEYVRQCQLPRMRGGAFGQTETRLTRGPDLESTVTRMRARKAES